MLSAALTALAVLLAGRLFLERAARGGPVALPGRGAGRSRPRTISLNGESGGGAAPESDEMMSKLADALGMPSLKGPVKKDLSVLVVRITGLDELVRQGDLDALFSFHDAFYRCLIRTAETFMGEIDSYDGKKAVMVFGRLLKLDDHEEAASGAAFGARRFLDEPGRVPSVSSKQRPGYVISVASGTAVAGPLGVDYRKVYTVLGGPVDEAHRLNALGRPGEIVFSGKSGYRCLEGLEGLERREGAVVVPSGVGPAPEQPAADEGA